MNDMQGSWTRIKEWTQTILVLTVIFGAAWILPPLVHRARRLCPVVHPDSVADTFAIPAFARKYGVSCQQCHYAFPVLNAYGRQFKMNGYVRERGSSEGAFESADKELWLEKYFPWSLILRSRPFDNGQQNVANAGANFGRANLPNGGGIPNGYTFQPITDADMFLAAGDASKHISAFGEYDAQAGGAFAPGGGDFSIGYHPFSYLNVILARRSFFGMDPYQTIADNESPTVAFRAVGAGMPDQGGLSGNLIGQLSQTAEVYGQLTKEGLGSLYYALGATSGNADDRGRNLTNFNYRVALDNNQGLMIGGFGLVGRETPGNIPAVTGTANATPTAAPARTTSEVAPFRVRAVKVGVDSLYEYGDLAARGAFMYIYDRAANYDNANDPLGLNRLANQAGALDAPNVGLRSMRDRAAYAEVMYSYKRGGDQYPFLLPLIRENWYTTYNGTRTFNFLTFHVAHYFRPNVKAFVEYSVDTKTDLQGAPLALRDGGAKRVPLGNRGTLQIEVGF